jgi:hypothetical protein
MNNLLRNTTILILSLSLIKIRFVTAEERFKDWIIYNNYNYFRYGIDENSGFPYDHIAIEKGQSFKYGKYTNPSIVGLWMVLLTNIIKGDLVLSDFSKIDAGRALLKVVRSIQKAPKWKGLLYWYDLKENIKPAENNIISSHDNGNFALSLMVVSGAFLGSEIAWQKSLKEEVDSLLVDQSIGWGELYDRKVGLLYGGYKYGLLSYFWIDRFYTESRLAALASLILADLPKDPWNNLLRDKNCPKGSYLLSYGESLGFLKPWQGAFQAWLPLLFVPEPELSLHLREMHSNYARIQIDYALNSKIPLLRSAAADPKKSKEGDYHYEPALGVFDASEDWVRSDIAAPYATALLYPIDQQASLDLFKKSLDKFPQIVGPLGFYDSISEEGDIAEVYLALNQLQLLLSFFYKSNQVYLLDYLKDNSKIVLLKELYADIDF